MSDALQRQKDKKGVLLYREEEFAVGLLWLTANTIDEDEDEESKGVKQRAKALNADFYCVRDTVVNQIGFGFIEQGHKRGLPGGASTAADVLVGEWHGVFRADNGWWYVAVHADAIAPDGDLLFTEEEDAYNHYLAAAESYRWPRTFVPDHWDIKENAGEVTLDKVFDEIPDATLQPANLDAIFGGKRNKEVAVVLGGILAGILVLVMLASQILPSMLPQPKAPPQVQIAAADILRPPPKAVEVAPEPEELVQFGSLRLPAPSFVVLSCLRGMEDLAVSLPLWRLQRLRCDGRIATAVWRSQGGDLDSIRNAISKFGSGVTRTYDGSSTLTATKLLDNMREVMEDVNPMPRDQAILMVNNRFDALGNLSLDYKDPSEARRQDTVSNDRRRRRSLTSLLTSETEDKAPYLTLKLNLNIPATKIAEYFNIPGLSFEMIEYDVSTGSWSYTANIILKKANTT